MREHRLYQADWLLRYYEFSTTELASSMPGGHLDACHLSPERKREIWSNRVGAELGAGPVHAHHPK